MCACVPCRAPLVLREGLQKTQSITLVQLMSFIRNRWADVLVRDELRVSKHVWCHSGKSGPLVMPFVCHHCMACCWLCLRGSPLPVLMPPVLSLLAVCPLWSLASPSAPCCSSQIPTHSLAHAGPLPGNPTCPCPLFPISQVFA